MDRREFVAALGGGAALAALLEETESVTVVRLPDCVTVDHRWNESGQFAEVLVRVYRGDEEVSRDLYRAERLYVDCSGKSWDGKATFEAKRDADPPTRGVVENGLTTRDA